MQDLKDKGFSKAKGSRDLFSRSLVHASGGGTLFWLDVFLGTMGHIYREAAQYRVTITIQIDYVSWSLIAQVTNKK